MANCDPHPLLFAIETIPLCRFLKASVSARSATCESDIIRITFSMPRGGKMNATAPMAASLRFFKVWLVLSRDSIFFISREVVMSYHFITPHGFKLFSGDGEKVKGTDFPGTLRRILFVLLMMVFFLLLFVFL